MTSSQGSSDGWLRTQALALGGLGSRPCPVTCWLRRLCGLSSVMLSLENSFLICDMQLMISTYILWWVLYQQGAQLKARPENELPE